MSMYKTKITRKGQITLPHDYREKLELASGSVVGVELRGQQILVSKPKANAKELFGAWSDMTDKDVSKVRSVWRGWNEKNLRRL